MPSKTPTHRQSYWLKHVKAADVSDGSIAEYAAVNDVNLKGLYQWKTKLMKLKLYRPASTPATDFVPITSSSHKTPLAFDSPAPTDRSGCTVIFTNGTRLEFHGELSAGVIRSIMTTVSQAH